jgi:hypothetical protein
MQAFMDNVSWKNVALVLAGVLVGCGARSVTGARADSSAEANQLTASADAPRWQQFCEETENPDAASRSAAARGAKGFELVAAAIRPNNDVTLCYKRRAQ